MNQDNITLYGYLSHTTNHPCLLVEKHHGLWMVVDLVLDTVFYMPTASLGVVRSTPRERALAHAAWHMQKIRSAAEANEARYAARRAESASVLRAAGVTHADHENNRLTMRFAAAVSSDVVVALTDALHRSELTGGHSLVFDGEATAAWASMPLAFGESLLGMAVLMREAGAELGPRLAACLPPEPTSSE